LSFRAAHGVSTTGFGEAQPKDNISFKLNIEKMKQFAAVTESFAGVADR
jgi:hypothetical protein